MRLTIIPEDSTVIINGRRFDIDCSALDSTIHAVQWDGERGHIEYKYTAGGIKPINTSITDVELFAPQVAAWEAAKALWDVQPPAPAAPALDEARAASMKAVNDRCALELAVIMSGYPDGEVQSWAKQEAEARAYLVHQAAPTLLLGALSAARGVPLAVLAEKVIEKADLFAAASGRAIGTRQACEDAINAAKTPEEALAVVWPVAPPIAEPADPISPGAVDPVPPLAPEPQPGPVTGADADPAGEAEPVVVPDASPAADPVAVPSSPEDVPE